LQSLTGRSVAVRVAPFGRWSCRPEGELQRVVNAALSGFFSPGHSLAHRRGNSTRCPQPPWKVLQMFKRRATNEKASEMREHPEGIPNQDFSFRRSNILQSPLSF